MSATKLNKDGAKAQSLAELKNGKVVFKQKPMSLEQNSETLQEIIAFRDMLSARAEASEPPLTEIPDDHKPVIAKLSFESDKTLTALCKHIQHTLLPPPDDEDDADPTTSDLARLVPLSAIEAVVKRVASRVNYGLEAPDGCKPPASACAWRWEISQDYKDWLPKNIREKADVRRQDRLQAKNELQTVFSALPADEQASILHLKNAPKPHTPSGDVSPAKQAVKAEEDADATPRPSASPSKAESSEREKQEKAAAKAERERKQAEAHDKSRSLMANFFSKKPAAAKPPLNSQPEAGSSQTDFEKTFKPFLVKKDTTLAPVNWFLEPKRARGTEDDVIVIDEDERGHEPMEVDIPPVSQEELERMTPRERLQDSLKRMPEALNPSLLPRGRPRPPGPKSFSRVSVRDIMTRMSEAEVTDDAPTVRRLRAKLQDRCAIPAKVLIFHTDSRPGYYGTWTRASDVIGPRTPLARDANQHDYGYDSGEEWEDEPVEADNVDEDDEEGVDEEEDSDADSWLVDDDDEEVEPGTPIDEREGEEEVFGIEFSSNAAHKRKAEDTKVGKAPKKKKIMPLVPFAKGPFYEQEVGHCEYEPFAAYRIQLFNDTPFPVDPFTYVSTAVEDMKRSKAPAPMPAVSTSSGPFLVPPLPDHVKASATTAPTASSSSAPPKPSALAPKNPFPDAHLPYLLATIQTMQAKSVTALVEKIHADLQEHKVRKNAIEAKIREVAEKSAQGKVWVLKAGVVGNGQAVAV
uniref:Chromatin assembly factor 1 subunit A dimerization domain-containing protein n=1 Tax=Schizophyllum commune (strain H4-8 / FGSC 9210) TaxID=578458 RepID=D8PWL3_SCHCM